MIVRWQVLAVTKAVVGKSLHMADSPIFSSGLRTNYILYLPRNNFGLAPFHKQVFSQTRQIMKYFDDFCFSMYKRSNCSTSIYKIIISLTSSAPNSTLNFECLFP